MDFQPTNKDYQYIHVIMTGYIIQLPWHLNVVNQLSMIMGNNEKAVFFDADGDRYNLLGSSIQAVIEVRDPETHVNSTSN